MNGWRSHRLQRALDSYILLPSLMALAAIMLALLSLHVDSTHDHVPLIDLPLDRRAAERLVSALSGALVTAMAMLFSITFVAVSITAAQLGPRLLRQLKRDRFSQAVLGLFMATFVYSLIAHYGFAPGDMRVVPDLTIVVLILLTVASMLAVVAFHRRLMSHVTADAAVARHAEQFILRLRDIWLPPTVRREEALAEARRHAASCTETIVSGHTGYVEQIDVDRLAALVRHGGVTIVSLVRPGHFVVRGQPIVCWSGDARLGIEPHVQAAIRFHAERSYADDIERDLHAIVEIALRALAPGTNDAYTAMTCLDHLSGCLAEAMRLEPPLPVCERTGDGHALIIPVADFAALMNTAFHPVRQQLAPTNIPVVIRLAEVLTKLLLIARTTEQRAAIEKHRQLLATVAHRVLPQPIDQADFGRAMNPRRYTAYR